MVVCIAGIHHENGLPARRAAEPADSLYATDEAGARLRLHAAQLTRRGAGANETRQLFINRLLHAGHVPAGLHGRTNDELTADLPRIHVRNHVGGSLIIVDEPPVQPRCFSLREHGRDELIQIIVVSGSELWDVPFLVDAGLRYAILHHLAMRTGPLRDPRFLFGNRRRGGNVAEVLLDFLARRLGRDVAGEHDDGGFGPEYGREPSFTSATLAASRSSLDPV